MPAFLTSELIVVETLRLNFHQLAGLEEGHSPRSFVSRPRNGVTKDGKRDPEARNDVTKAGSGVTWAAHSVSVRGKVVTTRHNDLPTLRN